MMEETIEHYNILKNRVIQLSANWDDYIYLFHSNEETIKILNSTAPSFFASFQVSQFELIILLISRLMDPKQTGKFNNLTIERIIYDLESKYYEVKDISSEFNKLKTEFKDFEDWRNKRIGHFDLDYATGKISIPHLSYEKCKVMVEHIFEFFRLIDVALSQSYMIYEVVDRRGSTKDLVHLLEFADKFKGYRHMTSVPIYNIIELLGSYDKVKELSFEGIIRKFHAYLNKVE